ncbi:hypothetical protein ACS0TY_000930 [Phlomoides rotata]
MMVVTREEHFTHFILNLSAIQEERVLKTKKHKIRLLSAFLPRPDLSAPGVAILAAWSEATTVTGLPQDTRVVPYNILSGTSMACPHATAAAAYVKSFHPTWSPAAIKSALMTTAAHVKSPRDYTVFASGSCNIDPVKAKFPGSVYDLNYPAFVVIFVGSNTSISMNAVFHRTVTNVGSPLSTYKVAVEAPAFLHIHVQPSELSFTSAGEKQSFVVTVNATIVATDLSGSLVWDDGVHKVRSPVIAF